jgi:hypothetical protein
VTVTSVVIIVLLLAVAAGAVAAVPLMLRGTRRPAAVGPRRPALGSPAEVWLSRGERVLRELDATLNEHGLWPAVSGDAQSVVAELRTIAGQVAELDHAMAQVPHPEIERSPDPENSGGARLRDSRERLLGRMAAAVTGLEQARAEVVELIATMSQPAVDPDPAGELTSRLAGLRAGLVEMRLLPDPETGSGSVGAGQGHP